MKMHFNLQTKKDFGLTLKRSFCFTLLIAFIVCGAWVQNATAQGNTPSGEIVLSDVVPSPVVGVMSEVTINLNNRMHVEGYRYDLKLTGPGFHNAMVTYDGGTLSLTEGITVELMDSVDPGTTDGVIATIRFTPTDTGFADIEIGEIRLSNSSSNLLIGDIDDFTFAIAPAPEPKGNIVLGEITPSPRIDVVSMVTISLDNRENVYGYQFDLKLTGIAFKDAMVTYGAEAEEVTEDSTKDLTEDLADEATVTLSADVDVETEDGVILTLRFTPTTPGAANIEISNVKLFNLPSNIRSGTARGTIGVDSPDTLAFDVAGRPIILRPSHVAQDRVIFNEIRNSEDDKNDWIEIKNISDADVSLIDWEISIVNSRYGNGNKDVDFVTFPDYMLPAGGVLLLVNTPPSETDLALGQNIESPNNKPNMPPQYLVTPEMRLPNAPYMLILRSATDKNGKPEAFEDLAGNYFRGSVDYGTQIWPLMHTLQPSNGGAAMLTLERAWQRVDTEARGYTETAWTLNGHQSGVGYKPGASIDTSLGTPGYANDMVMDDRLASRITFSELMFATNGGLFSQPQWIELYNGATTAAMPVNLKGWKLVVEARDSEVSHRHSVIELDELHIATDQTVLLVTRDRKHSTPLADDQIYDLFRHHKDVRELGLRENKMLSTSGFALKLIAPDGTLVDKAGNLDGEKGVDTPAWELPADRTEDGERTSLIRRYDGSMALTGTESMSWYSAAEPQVTPNGFYGHKTDIGTPGYREGGAAPVMLSHFRANRTDAGVVLEWGTQSELDNAGFNILRSETKEGAFVRVNPTLIPGAGTTAERNIYKWTDATSKPQGVYYYQIEDVSFAGDRQQLATVRMRGHVSASGKQITTWGGLKSRK